MAQAKMLPLFAALLAIAANPALGETAPGDAVFTVGKYPVDATAHNAVAAKEKALAEGQRAAFRSLLKRLVPVTAYHRLGALSGVEPANLIAGVAVKAERNSSTRYIATLDFGFDPRAVRELLRDEAIPYVDVQAPQVLLVPVYVAPNHGEGAAVPAAFGAAQGSRTWQSVWRGLDLERALVPVALASARSGPPADVLQRAQSDPAAVASVLGAPGGQSAVLAVAEPNLAGKRLNVTLSGQDAVGPFVLRRSFRLDPDDFAYTLELAAVIGLGVLEGRWKAARIGDGDEFGAGAPLEAVQLIVEFRNMREWQEIRTRITGTPGVEDFQVGGLSVRSADVALRYPGGGGRLAQALAAKGLDARNRGGAWLVQWAR
ncbi:MAG TPA: DUF2066 domain-containing protein [Hyphomicrobiaceae bacterium]|nr:DUF2066 domain-containing protein [Hyphomicrobiaceae bacterium]